MFSFANMKNSFFSLFIGAFFFSAAVSPVSLIAGDVIANGELSTEIPAPSAAKNSDKKTDSGKKSSFMENVSAKFKGKVKSASKKIQGSDWLSGFLDDTRCPTGIKGININVSEREDGIIIAASGSGLSANIILQQLISFYMPEPGKKHQIKSINFGEDIISGVKKCFNADLSGAFVFYQSDSSITVDITGNDDKTVEQIKKAAASWRSLKESRQQQKIK